MAFRFINFEDNVGRDVIEAEMKRAGKADFGRCIRKLLEIRDAGAVTGKNYTLFKGYDVQLGEFKLMDFRIINCRLSKEIFLLLRFFRKQSNNTPRSEIDIALSRLASYISNQKHT